MPSAETIENTKASPVQAKGNVDTVYVACKLPNGIVLQCDEMVEHREPVMGGGFKEVKVARRTGETYRIAGNALDVEKIKAGEINHLVIGGFAITPGIPKEFWDRWYEQHKHMDIVKGGHIYAHTQDASVRDYARDGQKLRSGLEPIDAENPQAIVRGIKPGTRDDKVEA